MYLKFKGLLVALFLSMTLAGYILAVEQCEYVEVDRSKPIHVEQLSSQYIKGQWNSFPKKLSLTKKKGLLGEVAAQDVIESLNWDGKRLVSITSMFKQQNCSVSSYFRDNADRGIDDIFVVVRADGWADQRFNPIFHESKFDGRCTLKLKDTETLCRQLSFQWIDGNLQKISSRTDRAKLCFRTSSLIARSCQSCKKEFQDTVVWLASMLKNGNFNRTASVLCSDGTFSLYEVNGA
ncbi:MAG: hypothetical protein K2Y18_10205 [Alphaproteobacteria bacterium]|jgi:hypothetical protein|nr:hypothetical protein [Alphaproteobacteria bacterium]